MVSINIGGKTIPLAYTLSAMADTEEQVGRINEVTELLKGKTRVRTMCKLIPIYARAAHYAEEITPEWVEEHLSPAQFMEAYLAVLEAYSAGMKMEYKQDDNEVVDVGLQEIKKNRGKR